MNRLRLRSTLPWAMNVPPLRPAERVTSPSLSSAASAWRNVIRLTPRRSASSRSGGSRAWRSKSPFAMRSRRCSSITSPPGRPSRMSTPASGGVRLPAPDRLLGRVCCGFDISARIPNGRDDVVVRIYRPGGRPAVEIESELAWMAALRRDAGVPAPEVLIPSGQEEPLLDLGTPGAPVYAAVFAYVPGREPGDDELPDLIETFGEITARMHRHARAWRPPPWFSRPRWDLSTTLGDRPHWGRGQRGRADPP